MNEFKEFQSKNLDQAIQDACSYFGTEREKLEIEIIEDAKMGVFGLIGARKAKIRARLVSLPEISVTVDDGRKQKGFQRSAKKPRPYQERSENSEKRAKPEKSFSDKPHFDDEEGESQKFFLSKMQNLHDEEELDERQLEAMDREAMQRANFLGNMTEAEIIAGGHLEQDRNGRYQKNYRNSRYQNGSRSRYEKGGYEKSGYEKPQSGKYRKFDKTEKSGRYEKQERPHFDKQERKPRFQKKTLRPQHEIQARPEINEEYEGAQLPKVNLLELDQEKLIAVVKDTIRSLTRPIVGDDAPIEITVEENRVLVRIESEDSGLLIGREGQHLSAIQYLAARIITTKMQVQVRVQLDTGDYHQRQDERMQSLALMLAERVRKTGRSQSTRPMSAYQRRVIHLALQDEPDVQTRSVGEGVLKRVIIMKKRGDYAEVPEELTADRDLAEDDAFMADEQELTAQAEQAEDISEEENKSK